MAEMLSKIMQGLCPVRHHPENNVSIHLRLEVGAQFDRLLD
jgi:hypothetical protein